MPLSLLDRRPFIRQSIEALTPRQKGCFCLFTDSMDAIYVGSGDIRQELLSLLAGSSPCVLQHRPTFWKAALSRTPDSDVKRLIHELDPICND